MFTLLISELIEYLYILEFILLYYIFMNTINWYILIFSILFRGIVYKYI